MHSPSARALHHLERYCIILVHTLNHLMPGKCVINITYYGLECYISLTLPGTKAWIVTVPLHLLNG